MFRSIVTALVVGAAAFLGVACSSGDASVDAAPTPEVSSVYTSWDDAGLDALLDPEVLLDGQVTQDPIPEWTFPWGPFERTVDDAPVLSWDLLSSQGVSGLLLGGN